MSRNSSGTYTLPAGHPVVGHTAISSAVENSTASDIANELTDSLSRSGKGGMTAPIRTSDGTVAAPAHSFTAETGTGWFRIAAGRLGAAILGVLRLEINASGVTVPDALAVTGDLTAGGDLLLTKTGAQTINKSGTGNIGVFAGAGQDVIVNLNNGSTWTFNGTTGMLTADGTHTVAGLLDPVNNQDADTKLARNTAISSALSGSTLIPKAWALLTLGGAGAVTVTAGSGVASATYATNLITVHWSAAFSSGTSYIMMATNQTNTSPSDFVPVCPAGGARTGADGKIFGVDYAGTARSWVSGDLVAVTAYGS
jgi:hypothetical protein